MNNINKILMTLNFIIVVISIAIASLDTIYYVGDALYLFMLDNYTFVDAIYESFKAWLVIFVSSFSIAIFTLVLHFKYLMKE